MSLVSDRVGYVTLYLDVTLNQEKIKGLVPIYQKGDSLYIDQVGEDLLGLVLPGIEALISLNTLAGATVTYSASAQTLALELPSNYLKHSVYTSDSGHLVALPPDPSLPGLVLNYNFYTTSPPNTASNMWTSMRAVGGDNRSLTNSMQTAWRDSEFRNTRLDTAFQQDLPDWLATLTVGDSVTSGLSWSRPTRIGGIRLSRNFDLAPYQTTAPMAILTGKAVVPSNIDVYVNNIRQYSRRVAPGDFTLTGIPLQNGQGKVAMVMTDINGKQRSYIYDVYGASPLLRENLLDASLEGGWVRKNWGLISTDYAGTPMMSGSLRYGVTDNLTAESHIENSRNTQLAGGGGHWLVGERFGVANASIAASHATMALAGWGSQWGYSWQASAWHLSFSSAYNTAGFRDVASEVSGGGGLLRRSQQFFIGTNTKGIDVSLGLIGQTDGSHNKNRYANLTLGKQWGQASYNLSFNHQAGSDGDNSVMLSASIMLSRSLSLNSTVSRGRQSGWINSLSRRNMRGNGIEWQLQEAQYTQKQSQVQAEVRYAHSKGDIAMGVTQSRSAGNSQRSAYGMADGGIALLPAGVFMARNTNDAFTLVSTNGMPGVPVMLENNLVGETDSRGYYLLGSLTPYQRNRISIDATNIPEEFSVGQTVKDTVPMRHNGTLSRFAILRHTLTQLRVRDSSGQDLPAGESVSWRSARSGHDLITQVGYDGQVYLQDVDIKVPLSIGSGLKKCQLILTPDLLASTMRTPAPVVCRNKVAGL